MYRSEDLAPLIAPDTGDPTVIRGGQGVVLEWNPETGENLIRYRGAQLRNLPIVASNMEILTIKPGDVVKLHLEGTAGVSTAYIVGRLTRPGQEAKAAILNTLSNSIFSANVAAIDEQAVVTGSPWQDLATPGPIVSNVPIGSTGRCLVILSLFMFSNPTTLSSGEMSFQVTGATSLPPHSERAVGHLEEDTAWNLATSRVVLLENLNPGLHTFTAKYRNGGTDKMFYENRSITVIAF